MTIWNWNGARWWKFDFHTHSPSSDDYGKGPSQAALKSRMPKEWLLDYMRAGIDCVAITDHNSGAWIDRLKAALAELESEKPESFRPIHLFQAWRSPSTGASISSRSSIARGRRPTPILFLALLDSWESRERATP